MHCRPVVRGEVIYTESSVLGALWQVRSGAVRVTNQTADGREVLFAIFGPGDCFGEISLIDGGVAPNTAVATERGELAELSKADFERLYTLHPAFSRQLNRLLCARVRHMLHFYADVTLRSLEQRMANRLVYLVNATPVAQPGSRVALTQQDLANMLGASRQAVSKILNQWRVHGLIALEYGGITILQPASLERIVDA
jgi:CRP-like cAMP-binding protein